MNAPRFERAQVVKNLSVGIYTLLHSFWLGLSEMGFGGNKGLAVLREACLAAIKKLEDEAKANGV